MKPKNKREAAVLDMANAMPALTARHADYMKARFDKLLFFRMNGGCKCSVCGHEWNEMPSTARYWRDSLYNALGMAEDQCPECGATLKPYYMRGKWRQNTAKSMQIMEVCNGWQVFRSVIMDCDIWEGQPTRYTMREEYQTWLNEKGQEVIVTRPYTRTPFSLNMRYDEPFTIGHHNLSYCGSYYYNDMFDQDAGLAYPQPKISATLRRNGWSRRFSQARAGYRYDIARRLLVDNRLETLAKSGAHTGTIIHYAQNEKRLERYWPQLRIAIRNGYQIPDNQIWEDMIDALDKLGRDTHSPRYILPADLFTEHDRWTRKLHEKELKEELRRKAQKDHKYYMAHKQFEALPEKQGKLLIRPLLTATELVLEGEAMHHCVGTYGDKLTSLILSIRDTQGRRLETAEVDLKKYNIVQSRAVNNGTTARHDEILTAIKRLMPEIVRCNQAV